MKKLLVCLLVLALLMTGVALAEIRVETTQLENMITIGTASNSYYARVDGGYQLFDAQGNAVSAVYANLTTKGNGMYYEYPGSGLNYIGILDSKGQVVTEPRYGKTYPMENGWALGYVLEPVAGDTGDFRDGDNNWYNTTRTDVIYDGRVIGSLSREEYVPSFSTNVTGNYLYVKQTSDSGYWLDTNFNRYIVEEGFTYSEFTSVYKKGVFHNPTQQWAFTAGCTLTPDDVSCPVWYDDSTDCLIDLQGNVIKSGVTYDSVYQEGNYLRIRHNGLYGIIDLEGNVIVAPVYKELPYYYGFFPNGTQTALTPEGHLHFLDEQGNVTAKAEYELTSSNYKGFTNNSPFVAVNNMGKYIVFTAAKGELPTKYEDCLTPQTNQDILVVKKDGLWGAIDVNGNTVLPFIHRSSPSLSQDGTLAYGQNEAREYFRYNISYGEAASVPESWTETKTSGEETDTTPVLNEGAWECTCGVITNGKFCPECGSKKPEPTATPAPTPAPAADDGSWTCTCGSVNAGKFCPECGTKKPEATPVPDPQCASCGYKPEGATPKFCPECGTKF